MRGAHIKISILLTECSPVQNIRASGYKLLPQGMIQHHDRYSGLSEHLMARNKAFKLFY